MAVVSVTTFAAGTARAAGAAGGEQQYAGGGERGDET